MRGRRLALPALALLSAAAMSGCNTEARRQESTTRAPGTRAPDTTVTTQPLQQAPGTGAGGQAAVPPAPGGVPAPASIADRPSVDENMGRGFQGTLALRLVGPQQSYGLRYSSRGNAARLQVDPLEAGNKAENRHLDALIWGENLSLLDHRNRTVQTFPLDGVTARADAEGDVEIEKTGDRATLLGVGCERYEMKDGPLRIRACVGALPGTFDVDKLETAARIDVPAWLEDLLKEELLPLQGSVSEAGGRQLYSFELTEYSPGPVDESQLALPTNYEVTPGGGAAPR